MSNQIVRHIPWKESPKSSLRNEQLLTREWLITNGLGGYACGTISGVATRRYHALLVAALPAPFGRMLLLAHLFEQIQSSADTEWIQLGGEESVVGTLCMHGAEYLEDFWLQSGIPVWRYRVGGVLLEKRMFMPHEQNTVYVQYRLVPDDDPQHPSEDRLSSIQLRLIPTVHFRPHEAPVSTPLPEPFVLTSRPDGHELTAANDVPPLRLSLRAEQSAFTIDGHRIPERIYRMEESRGYEASGDLWSPGYFQATLSYERSVTFVASTEEWESFFALTPEDALASEFERRRRLIATAHPAASTGMGAELVLAADQFLIKPAGRVGDEAVAHAHGDEARTVIAGYHWFTDWGRDTMISLEGLTLTTGRHAEAGYILRTFAHHFRDGLIPNLFPEGMTAGLYHTADATLWFFHALHRYSETTGDHETVQLLLPKLRDSVDWHIAGTRFGIGVDPQDHLLRQGAEGYQLTWMDAKVGDWVVTPRRGKAVEINALWYNALRLLESWERQWGDKSTADDLAERAEQTRLAFNQRFWFAEGNYLFDVVDGETGENDAACRPNQVFAISLPYPVLDENRWLAVMEVVENRLLTPLGLRSLAPGHPAYKPTYDGDLRARDAAYHQGTVWGWLIGPFIDAWLKVHEGDIATVQKLLQGFAGHLGEGSIGSISEIFDAEAPYWPRGCVAQAWSVAEVLRCWVNVQIASRRQQDALVTGV